MISQLGHMTSIYGFISIFARPLTNLGKMVDQYARPQPWNDDVFTISRLCNKLLCISTFMNPMTTTICKTSMHWAYVADDDDVTTTSSRY